MNSAARTRLAQTLTRLGEATLATWLVTTAGVSGAHIDGTSMVPALRGGETVAVARWRGVAVRAGFAAYRRGDVVMLRPPGPGRRPWLIKRVAAVPGDTVSLRAGVLRVGGHDPEGALRAYWTAQGCLDTTSALANTVVPGRAEMTVPPHHYVVLGDNRSTYGSADSRAFGVVGVSDIAGPVLSLGAPHVRSGGCARTPESPTSPPPSRWP